MPLWWESLAWTEVVTVFPASLRNTFYNTHTIIHQELSKTDGGFGGLPSHGAFGNIEIEIELYSQMRILMDKN